MNKETKKFIKRVNKDLKPYKKDAVKLYNKSQKQLVKQCKNSDKAKLITGAGLFVAGIVFGAALKAVK